MKRRHAALAAGALLLLLTVAIASLRREGADRERAQAEPSPSRSPEVRGTRSTGDGTPAPAPGERVTYLPESGQVQSSTPVEEGASAPGTHRIASSIPVTPPGQGRYEAPRWSADGAFLYVADRASRRWFRVPAGGGPIAIAELEAGWVDEGEDAEGNARVRAQTAAEITGGNEENAPAAFVRNEEVYVRRAPGEAPRQVTAGEDRFLEAELSPDGRVLAYTGANGGLYLQPTDGSAPPKRVGEGGGPIWLPDGSGVIFSSGNRDESGRMTGGDLFHVTPDGHTLSNLTGTPEVAESAPAVSPDGRRIAFEANGTVFVGALR